MYGVGVRVVRALGVVVSVFVDFGLSFGDCHGLLSLVHVYGLVLLFLWILLLLLAYRDCMCSCLVLVVSGGGIIYRCCSWCVLSLLVV